MHTPKKPDFKNRFNQKYTKNSDSFGSKPLPIVKKAMKYVSSGEALDLGAGNGRNTLFLLSNSFKVTSVDSSEEGLKLLEEKVGTKEKLTTILSDVRKFQTENTYDIVLAIGLLHFLSKEEGNTLIKNMQKWTRIGGLNVVGAKMTQNFANDLPHVFEKNELRKYYEKSDWEIKEYTENKVAFLIAKKIGGIKMNDKDNVINIIKKIKHPMIDMNLIELGILSHVAIKNNTLHIVFSFTFPNIPIKDKLINSVKEKIEGKSFKLVIETNIMNEKQRERFLRLESKAWKG